MPLCGLFCGLWYVTTAERDPDRIWKHDVKHWWCSQDLVFPSESCPMNHMHVVSQAS
jgi:hypothetical protein